MSDADNAHDGYVVRLPRRLVVRALMVLTAGVFLFVVLLLVFAIGPRLAREENPEPEPFCCPDEGRWIAAVVNGSVDPCEDLYSYVCTPAVTTGIDKSASLMKSLEAMITAGAVTGSSSSSTSPLSKSLAGVFLQKLYSACVVTSKKEALHDQRGRNISLLSAQMASALWDNLNDLLSHLNSTNLLMCLLITNLRYHIRSVVEIDYTSWDRTFFFSHDALEWGSEMHLLCEECVAAALQAYHQHAGTNETGDGGIQEAVNGTLVTFDAVAAFATHLHSLYAGRKIVGRFVMANVSQLWPAEDVISVLQVLPWLDSGAYANFEALAFPQIVTFRRELTKRENWAVGAVYLIAHMVGRAYMDLPPEEVKEIHCLYLTTKLKHLVSTAFWELYSTPEKEALITDLYKSILYAVNLDASRHIVSSEHEDARTRLSNVMNNVTLVTASVINAAIEKIPEEADRNYALALLAARSFEFEAWKHRISLGLPTWFTEEKPVLHTRQRLYVEVPASFYSFVRVSKGPNPVNMAVLGVRLAEILWRVVLQEEWTGEAQAKVEALLRCFGGVASHAGDDHPMSVDEHAVAVYLAAGTLALRSVMKAALVQDWYTVRVVGGGGHGGAAEASSPRLSHAQFFFLEEAQGRCPRRKAKWPNARVFNVPAALVPEFGRAFGCSRQKSKDKQDACAVL